MATKINARGVLLIIALDSLAAAATAATTAAELAWSIRLGFTGRSLTMAMAMIPVFAKQMPLFTVSDSNHFCHGWLL